VSVSELCVAVALVPLLQRVSVRARAKCLPLESLRPPPPLPPPLPLLLCSRRKFPLTKIPRVQEM